MSFVVSQAIWHTVIDALENRDLTKAQQTRLDAYFTLTEAELESALAQMMNGLLTSRQSEGFALVWGLPLVYEFLRDCGVLEPLVVAAAIAAVEALKQPLMERRSLYLWQFDFVHRWPRPECVSEAAFAAEAERFATTIDRAEPLSDNPDDAFSLAGMIEAVTEGMALDRRKVTLDGAATALEIDDGPSAKQTWKPPKPRKSPLQEVKALQKKKPSKPSKKSGKKGFS